MGGSVVKRILSAHFSRTVSIAVVEQNHHNLSHICVIDLDHETSEGNI